VADTVLRRRGLSVGIVLSVLVAINLLVPPRAFAAYAYLYIGPPNSWGFAEWFDTSNGVRLIAQPTTIVSGYCLDSWFDWGTEGGVGGHYDARVARSCRALYQRDSGWNYEAHDVKGANKRAACYGPWNATLGNCAVGAGSLDYIDDLPNTCTRSWWLTQGGSYLYDGGGNPRSCSS
jgi:hypothetical protein